MDNLDFNYFCTDCKQSADYRRDNCFTRYRIRNFEKGEHIAYKGDKVRELSVVVEGAINVSFILDSGLVMRSIDHRAPAPIGAVAILSKDDRYIVETKAIEPSVVISIPKEEVISQMQRCQEFMMNFIDSSASRVRALSEHLALLSQRNLSAKLAYYILVCSEDGKRYRFTKSIQALSEYLCVERPSLSRIIAKFTDDKLITYHNGTGEIINPKGLKALTE